MNLKEVQRNWNAFGKIDPLWAILTWPEKRGNQWQLDEFFKTGQEEVDSVMRHAQSLGSDLRNGTALDFGCGVGRLTQALAEKFDEACGVDIAPSMLDLARKHNKHGDRCKYCLNEADDLRVFRSDAFDFILSIITLQHMQPRYSKNYIREFLRVLAPGGLLVFQLPNDPIADAVDGGAPSNGWKQFVRSVTPEVLLGFYRRVRRLVENKRSSQPTMGVGGGSPEDVAKSIEQRMGMWGVKREEVKKFVEQNGGKILDVLKDQAAGPGCVSFRYFITK